MASLSTHVLDTANGTPAAGLTLELFAIDGEQRQSLGRYVTNSDGRVDGKLIDEPETRLGEYEIVFHAGDYLAQNGGTNRYLTQVPIRFSIFDQSHYHVPLLVSSYGFSTYRGS